MRELMANKKDSIKLTYATLTHQDSKLQFLSSPQV